MLRWLVVCTRRGTHSDNVQMHDGAPAHFSRTALRYLDRRFPDRWICRGGPIAWHPRSPDLNPLDFYLWGHLKSLVYSSPVPDLESLRNRIVACSEDIRNTPGVWDRVRRSMRHRFKQVVDILDIFCNDNDLRKEKRSVFNGSRPVASWSKASCLGLALRNARWFEFSWGKKFSHEISASVWDRCPPSIVMHLGSYDR
ncbi:hypothetical protein ANN_19690 [Periplaneta americana]|uniref:Uncharacterized protein n=1 Tax=Periplaneta americana TaxID=6978 RepID=A0ABQ8SAS4_PERAM|nr:hypothetical protein ANN_19690 [Periplaneta americana]